MANAEYFPCMFRGDESVVAAGNVDTSRDEVVVELASLRFSLRLKWRVGRSSKCAAKTCIGVRSWWRGYPRRRSNRLGRAGRLGR
ncbi:unnamed protein product [Cochlearia groenlandica]